MKLKLNTEESFSGLPQLLDAETGKLVLVVTDAPKGDEILKRINAYAVLVSHTQRALIFWTTNATNEAESEYMRRWAQRQADAVAHFLTSIGEL